MAKITVNMGNFKVDEIELEQGTLSIGRNHDNQLHIDDAAVSNHHAKIVTVFDSTYVEDLGSTNGTFVNGQKSKTHTLHNGDVLTIGHYQLLFQSEIPAAMNDANATMMIGVSQLEELTKKARQSKSNRHNKAPKVSHAVSGHSTQKIPPASSPDSKKPALKVHNNAGTPITHDKKLPDIEDNADLLDRKKHPIPSSTMRPLRKSDTSPLPSLKVIALAVMATVATFTLLMVFYK
ncbi:MAG: FHA domain-containing protein [Ectothiorhodospiraceae bacterium]|nr:FHA domain-containing protein [Ectothiorhodospiraceae bacterium]